MSILTIEGFDTYAVVSDAESGWTANWSVGYLPQISLPAGRYDGQCMHINAGGAQENISRTFPWSVNTLTVGADYRNTTTVNNIQILSLYHTGNTNHIYLRTDGSGHLQIYNGFSGTLLATSTSTISVNTWMYIELGVFVHDTTGTIDVWVDGINFIHLTGVDTKVSASADTLNSMTIYESGVADWDNMYWADVVETRGPLKVSAFVPTGDGPGTGFTAVGAASLYDAINDATDDADTTYITASNSGDYQTFSGADIAGTTIVAVQVNIVAKKSDSGARSIAAYAVNDANTDDVVGDSKALTTAYARYASVLNNAPDGGSWTVAKLNGSNLGVKVTV